MVSEKTHPQFHAFHCCKKTKVTKQSRNENVSIDFRLPGPSGPDYGKLTNSISYYISFYSNCNSFKFHSTVAASSTGRRDYDHHQTDDAKTDDQKADDRQTDDHQEADDR